MKSEISAFGGWSKNLFLSNDSVELVVSLEVGPRILSYRLKDRENVFKNFEDQLGSSNESEWKIRGGHRLWTAPESKTTTYHVDNGEVAYAELDGGEIVFSVKQTDPIKLKKDIGVTLDRSGSKVVIRHTVRNEGEAPLRLATWGLSVMNPGGVEILPNPKQIGHPEGLLPNRNLILWPYTDLSDARLHLGNRFITLQQSEEMGPLKFGLSHREGWVAYLWQDCLFIKQFEYEPNSDYADLGCNFETFTNENFLEIESLGPLVDLSPGHATSHDEKWFLYPLDSPAELTSEDELAEWLRPYLEKSGLSLP